MRRSIPPTATTDSSGHLKTGPMPPGRARLSGAVVLADGSVPEELVDIYAECGGTLKLIATADSKGRFSVSRDSLREMTGPASCAVRAFLEGYHSDPKTLTAANPGSDEKVGNLVLQPLSARARGLTSAADEQVSRAQQKTYEKALDQAARTEWPNAVESLRKLTSACPGYSSAWLTLGILELGTGDRRHAEESFAAAIRADPNFALPLIRAATLEATQADWSAARDHSRKAIDLDPDAFPDAWAVNALANLTLQDVDAARKSAREGLRVDRWHEYPELEYALGSVLYSKQDVTEAIAHLQRYIDLSPNGMNADTARSALAQMRTPASPAVESISATTLKPAEVNEPAAPAEAGPPASALRERNAPLLAKTLDYTCLESITRTRFDNRGHPHGAELLRVEIGVADDREMYGYVDGKRFSGDSLAAMLGNTFSTTGVYSVLARALIAGNGITTTFAGRQRLNGEAVYRYDFRSSPGEARWAIQYGKVSGRAGEEGSFFVDAAQLILRRVVIRAADIPVHMKLKKLAAVVDYEPETMADRRVLLPYVAQVHVEEGAGVQRVSRMFFDHCRSFTSNSTVTFESDKSLQENQRAANPELPPDLDISVLLSLPVSVRTAAENDVLTGAVAAPVSRRGHEIIAGGAIVEGHVHPCRGQSAVVVELDRVQTRNGWAPFYARLVSVGSPDAAIDDDGKRSDPEIPGVAKIVFIADSAQMAAGTRMVWKTESLVMPGAAAQPQLGTAVNMK